MQPSTEKLNVFDDFVRRYAFDAYLFVYEVLGMDGRDKDHTIDEHQKAMLDAYSRGERRMAIRSGHRVGKTTTLAWILTHHILFRFPQKALVTAPTAPQLFEALAAETKAWMRKLPPVLYDLLEVKSESIHLKAAPEESFISYNTSRAETPEALAGKHSKHILLIGDEASGIPEPVFEASLGSMASANASMILAGNPVRTQGFFHKIFNDPEVGDRWWKYHISSENHPRVDREFVEDVIATYGQESNAYRVRVLGEFPLSDSDTVIPFDLMEAALTRDVQPTSQGVVWGLDVARFGDDRSALAKRRDNVLLEPVKSWVKLSTMEVVGRVKNEYDSTPTHDRPMEIMVDAIGYGAGVADRLMELGLPARAINVSESPSLREQFANLRAELYFDARKWFESRVVNLANDKKLGGELTMLKYKFQSSGKRLIESKADLKKRTNPKRSPDLADAFVLTFAAVAITAAEGGKPADWKKPLKRKIGGLA